MALVKPDGAYVFTTQGNTRLAQPPIILDRDPSVFDSADDGAIAVNSLTQTPWAYGGAANGVNMWYNLNMAGGGNGVFNNLTATGVTALGVTGVVGGFTQTGGTFSVGADATASTANINTGAGAKTTNIGSTNTTSTTTVSAGSGGLNFSSGGNLSTAAVTATAASPTATAAINARVGKATFTGFTTANAGATQAFTVTNTGILTTSGVLLTVTHLNASGNGAFLQIQNITQIAGSLVVTVANNGAGALGAGDDVIISFWQFN